MKFKIIVLVTAAFLVGCASKSSDAVLDDVSTSLGVAVGVASF